MEEAKLPELESYYDGMARGHSVRKKMGTFPFTSAEAAEIVNRCNSHNDLLAALQKISDHEDERKKVSIGYDWDVDFYAKQAIAKAKLRS